MLALGGDTDTVGAIAGALAGAAVGARGIPADWLDGIVEWPRSVAVLAAAAARLTEQAGADGGPLGPVGYFWPGVVVRNAAFLAIVLSHGLRRLAPPYG